MAVYILVINKKKEKKKGVCNVFSVLPFSTYLYGNFVRRLVNENSCIGS